MSKKGECSYGDGLEQISLENVQNDPRFDWERRDGPDHRDPLHNSCDHPLPWKGGVSLFAAYFKCQKCSLRMLYVPRTEAPREVLMGARPAAGPSPADVPPGRYMHQPARFDVILNADTAPPSNM